MVESMISATQAEYEERRKRFLRQSFVYAGVSLVTDALCAVLAFMLAGEVFGDSPIRWIVGALVMTLMTIPVTGFIAVHALQQEKVLDALTARREADLRDAVERADLESARRQRQGQHQDFEARLLNALEMAENETEVLGVVRDAFAVTLAETPVELLLADNSHAHLVPVATIEHDGHTPGCQVESPNQCPAARRAQMQRFPDSDALDACPKLRNRLNGSCGAVCVPVSIMGRTVGVIHATGEVGWTVDDDDTGDLQTLAKQAGARLGLLRIMAETQLQAETDGLTGLANRRTMENQIHALRRRREPFALAMIDLDHFKELNDSLGHETGDRALRFFAHTLRDSVRSQDLVCRHGGEEFVVVFPGATASEAALILERVRDALQASHQLAGMPPVTASFGVVDSEDDELLDELFRRADAMLFEAKHAGRDRVVVAGAPREPELGSLADPDVGVFSLEPVELRG
jgi:diguanylate cyclase (GGDEF)-like protein